jgi:hypothetical protein
MIKANPAPPVYAPPFNVAALAAEGALLSLSKTALINNTGEGA